MLTGVINTQVLFRILPLRIHGCSFHIMTRRQYLAGDILVLWLLDCFCSLFPGISWALAVRLCCRCTGLSWGPYRHPFFAFSPIVGLHDGLCCTKKLLLLIKTHYFNLEPLKEKVKGITFVTREVASWHWSRKLNGSGFENTTNPLIAKEILELMSPLVSVIPIAIRIAIFMMIVVVISAIIACFRGKNFLPICSYLPSLDAIRFSPHLQTLTEHGFNNGQGENR